MAARMTKQKFTEMLGFLRWYAREESSGRLSRAADMLEWARGMLFPGGDVPGGLALEYRQICARTDEMGEKLDRWDELGLGPESRRILWSEQWQAMVDYRECLRKRGERGEFDLKAAEGDG